MRKLLMLLVALLWLAPVSAQVAVESDTAQVYVVNFAESGLDMVVTIDEEPFEAGFFWDPLLMPAPAGEVSINATPIGGSDFGKDVTATLEADRQYIVAVYGPEGDEQIGVYDMLELSGGIVADADSSPWFQLNGLQQTLTFEVEGEVIASDVAYGDMVAYDAPLRFFDVRVIAEDGTVVSESSDGFGEPYYSSIAGYLNFGGSATSGGVDFITTDPLTYLADLTTLGIERTSYNTFLKLVETAGLAPDLAGMTGVYIIVPDDAAFAALPPGSLSIISTDPGMLNELLMSHIVPANNMPRPFEFSGTQTVETLAGTTITIDADGPFYGGAAYDYHVAAPIGFVIHVDAVVLPDGFEVPEGETT